MGKKEEDARFDRAKKFLTKFNESDTASQLPFDTKKAAFKDAEHKEAIKEDRDRGS
jgi:hypothetical protein